MPRKRKPSEAATESRVISEVEQVLRKLTKEMEEDKKNKFFKVEEE